MNSPYATLLGEAYTETDKLGNTHVVQADDESDAPLTRREQRKAQLGLAASPPDRRRGRDMKDTSTPWETHEKGPGQMSGPGNAVGHSEAQNAPRGRQFDRHSGTGISDSIKKTNRGWGDPVTAEIQAAADDTLPLDSANLGNDAANPQETADDDGRYMTLDEYRAMGGNDKFSEKYGRLEARPSQSKPTDFKSAAKLE